MVSYIYTIPFKNKHNRNEDKLDHIMVAWRPEDLIRFNKEYLLIERRRDSLRFSSASPSENRQYVRHPSQPWSAVTKLYGYQANAVTKLYGYAAKAVTKYVRVPSKGRD